MRGHPTPTSRSAAAPGGPAIEARIQLRPVATSASIARRFVATTLHTWGCAGVVEVATLLVSEVVTNAVLHARSDLELHLISGGHFVRIEVADGSTTQPVVRDHSDDALSGRGLALVERLASAWGVRERPGGKVVWFEIAA